MQHTETDQYCKQPWACPVLAKKVVVSTHIHYRLVVGEVGYGLERLKGTRELLSATYDAFHGGSACIHALCAILNMLSSAMRDASDKASMIHRDISVGNIVLVREVDGAPRKGYLIDWEMSDKVDEHGHALERARTVSMTYHE